jgi:ribonuclease E
MTNLPQEASSAGVAAEFMPLDSTESQAPVQHATPTESPAQTEMPAAAEAIPVALEAEAEVHLPVLETTLPPAIAEPVAAIAVPVEVIQSPALDPAPSPLVVDVSASLQQAGLVMIETSSAQPQLAAIVLPEPALGRKPRAAPTPVSEPLQMVETRRD